MDIIQLEQVEKVYGTGEKAVAALRGITLSISKGQFVAILGASGSGKSTLLHMMGGLEPPTSGTVYVEGENIYRMPDDALAIFRRRKVGIIFQAYNLVPMLNVEENIHLPVLLDHEQVDQEYYQDIMELLGIQSKRYAYPSELSGGQQQRVSIARALIHRPSFILADEPTGNLDSKKSKEVLELLRVSAKRYHQTLVMITHDLSIAEQADRVVTIEDGAIISDISYR
ncbi:peptide ABC transporter ATP-binding protein [Paenibacillus selenitireducens]|uniref:Peptide ABC transporter ATP-binding protein n=1 Tax=Paenibacillus selenitireducens TaxID=1324314 RepID=A0A1T2X742_9BACL|nr:ABC transporter ATP-binding protein [Paenibacillus selenitireducens]OPA75697.1 peptide ABC transporter ATP-binding protein [Paenibacillus selenitireducens]